MRKTGGAYAQVKHKQNDSFYSHHTSKTEKRRKRKKIVHKKQNIQRSKRSPYGRIKMMMTMVDSVCTIIGDEKGNIHVRGKNYGV